MRAQPLVGLGAALLVFAVGADSGGFFPRTWRWTSLAVFAAAGAVLLLRERIVVPRRSLLALAILLGLAGWMLVSQAWSAVPSLAAPEAERALVYAAVLILAAVVVRAESGPWLPAGIVAAATALSAWGLGDYAASHASGAPLVGPLGYANGAGALAAIGAVLAVGLALRADRRPAQLVVAAPLAVLVPTLVLSRSDGAWIALVAGLAVLVVVHRRWIGVRLLVGAAAVAAVGLVVWLAYGHPLDSPSGNIRWSYWRAALLDYRSHPVLGSGAGTFGRYWDSYRTTPYGALDAHSLYVESLAELGPVGLALVLGFVATVAAAAVRASRELAPAAAAFVVYAVHTGIDWDWELPAVTLPGVILAGLLLTGADRSTARRPLTARTQLGLAAGCTALAVLALVRLKTAA